MVKNDYFKKGFTVAEMLVCMLILSVLIALSVKVFTRHHQKQLYNPVHGYFLCYVDSETGKVMQKNGSSDPVVMDSNYCSFRPVKSANYYVLYSIAGGGGGGTSKGGSQGEFTSVFLTSIADNLSIYPGKGGKENTDGEDTYITNPDGEKILTDAGGYAGKVNSISSANVESCEAYPLPNVLDLKKFKDGTSDIPKCNNKDSKYYVVASLCSPDVQSINQDEVINEFFDGFFKAYKEITDDYTVETYDGKYQYDSSTRRLYYKQIPTSSGYSNGDKFYALDEHALYVYDRNYWYYDGAKKSSGESAPACIEDQYWFYNFSSGNDKLSSEDSGRYLIRTSENFKIVFKLNKNLSETNLSENESDSEFVTFVKNSGLLNDSLSLVEKAGVGGKANNAGYPGAVMISW
jgi:prepilin-type N-terminal cleavage/methylation domain-containing protein